MKKTLVFCCFALALSLSLVMAFQAIILKVKVQTANARSEPDLSAVVIKTFRLGTILESSMKIGEWYEIIVNDERGNRTSAYINVNAVNVISGEEKPVQVPPQPEDAPVYQPPTEFAAPKTAGAETARAPVVQPPKWEFSTAASFAMSRISYEEQANTVTTISVPLRLGYYLTKSIELEPELVFARLSQEDTSATNVSAMANVLYNFSLSQRMSAFVLGGAGVILSSATIEDVSESRTNFGFNGGAGLRWLISNSVALRAEYRLVSYTDQPEDLESKVTYMDHKGFLGISVFF